MNGFNRVMMTVLWLVLLAIFGILAVMPLEAIAWLQTQLVRADELLIAQKAVNPTNVLIGQIAVAVTSVLLFGFLIAMEIWTARRHGVRIRTAQGGSAELDTSSVSRRLSWRLDQLAEVVTVVPTVKARGGAVDIKLEVETAPDVDVSMKTDEVVEVTRGVIEQDMGLKLGKLDVRMRYAPIDPDWVQ